MAAVGWVIRAAAIGTMALGAMAQQNPLGQKGPANPLDQKAPANPLDQKAPANPLDAAAGGKLAPMQVPDFIKPGARIIYSYMSTTDPRVVGGIRGSTDGGLMRYDVLAVLPDRVLVTAGGLAEDANTGDCLASGSNSQVITAQQVDAGVAIWMDVKQLAAMQNGPNLTVTPGDFPLGGKTYQSVTIVRQLQDSTSMNIFDRGTGLLLSGSLNSGKLRQDGPANMGLNREIQTSSRFVSYRAIETPWLKANSRTPDWATKVTRLTYEGSTRMIDNANNVTLPMQLTATVAERGEGWASFRVAMRSAGDAMPETAQLQGAGSLGGYWINPAVFRELKEGVLDTDPTLGSVLRYDVKEGNLGRLGVFTTTSRRGTQVSVSGYSLEDGVLTYSQSVRREINMIVEFSLKGRE